MNGELNASSRPENLLSLWHRPPKGMELFDIPTTLRLFLYAIKRTFTDEFLNKQNNRSRIERREISNFEKTLRLVLRDELGPSMVGDEGLIRFQLLNT